MRKFVLVVGLLAGATVLLLVLAGLTFHERSVESVPHKNLQNLSLAHRLYLPTTALREVRINVNGNETDEDVEAGIRSAKRLDLDEYEAAYNAQLETDFVASTETPTQPNTPAPIKRSLFFHSAKKDAIIKQSQAMRRQRIVQGMIDSCLEGPYDGLINEAIKGKRLSQPIKSGGTFDNPFSTWKRPALTDAASFVLFEPDKSGVPRDSNELDRVLPVLKPDFKRAQSEPNRFRATWIGHSTILIQGDGVNILTDPVFSDRASFTQFAGPKRIRPPACQVNELPPIHIVLISHNHYDHLDTDSVRQINNRFGNDCKWIVPLGIGQYLESMSVTNYVELDWWQKDCFSAFPAAPTLEETIARSFRVSYLKEDSEPLKSKSENESALQIYLTPAQHWSRRWIGDYNKSLWGSFVIINSQGLKFFFAGDTGYCTAFKEIGEIFGPFSGAAIPIGAYHPRSFLKYAHVDPEHAVRIHQDIKSEKSFAIHHSTFILSYEPYREPAKLLNETIARLNKEGLQPKPFSDIRHGESIDF